MILQHTPVFTQRSTARISWIANRGKGRRWQKRHGSLACQGIRSKEHSALKLFFHSKGRIWYWFVMSEIKLAILVFQKKCPPHPKRCFLLTFVFWWVTATHTTSLLTRHSLSRTPVNLLDQQEPRVDSAVLPRWHEACFIYTGQRKGLVIRLFRLVQHFGPSAVRNWGQNPQIPFFCNKKTFSSILGCSPHRRDRKAAATETESACDHQRVSLHYRTASQRQHKEDTLEWLGFWKEKKNYFKNTWIGSFSILFLSVSLLMSTADP